MNLEYVFEHIQKQLKQDNNIKEDDRWTSWVLVLTAIYDDIDVLIYLERRKWFWLKCLWSPLYWEFRLKKILTTQQNYRLATNWKINFVSTIAFFCVYFFRNSSIMFFMLGYMYIRTHIHTHTHIYIYIHTNIYIYIYIYIYVYMHTHTYTYIYTHTHSSFSLGLYTPMDERKDESIYIYIYIYTHTNIHIYWHTHNIYR